MTVKPVSRRAFLRSSGMALGSVFLGACAQATPTPEQKPAATQAPASAPTSAPTEVQPTAVPVPEGGTMRVYFNPGHDYQTYRDVSTQFEQDHPGWKVEWEFYQWPDMRTKLLANFAAGDPPDMSASSWMQEFTKAGYYLSLQPYVERDGKEMGYPDDWQPAAADEVTSRDDGQPYGIKTHHTCMLIFYNKKMLAEAGVEPPTTWEEFLDVARATAQGNVFGFAPNQAMGYTHPWFLQNGCSLYDPQTNTVPMDNEAAYEALQFQADMVHKHKVAPIPMAAADYEGPQKLFTAERAAMILTGPWDTMPVLQGNPNLEWDMAQALTRKVQATSAAGISVTIPKAAKYPDMAWELIKRLVTLETEVAASKETGMLMPRKSWAEHPEIQAMERVAPFAKALSYATFLAGELFWTGKAGEIGELHNKACEHAIYENRPAAEVLNEFVVEANKVLQRS